MDLRQLEIFIEIAASGGYNRAAARLHVAQSALSRRILKLEHELGVTLFTRGKRGVQLTPAGTLLNERAGALLRQLKQVRDEVAAEASIARGELSIGLPPSLSGALSAPLLQALQARFPNLFIRTWVSTSIALRDLLLAGKIDIAVFGVVEPEQVLHTRALFRDPMYLVSSPRTPPDNAGWTRIAGLPLILTSQPNSVRRLVDSAASKRRQKLNVVMEVNDVPLLLDMIKGGAGHTLLPFSAIRDIDRTSIAAVRIPQLAYQWVAAWSKERPLIAASQQALHEIERIGQTLAKHK